MTTYQYVNVWNGRICNTMYLWDFEDNNACNYNCCTTHSRGHAAILPDMFCRHHSYEQSWGRTLQQWSSQKSCKEERK